MGKHHRKHCHYPHISSTFVSGTLFIDAFYGNDTTAIPNDPSKPFKTINYAINTIYKFQRDPEHQYILRISPGVYNEIVTTIPFINIIGASKSSVFIKGLISTSTASIRDLTISSTTLPLINIQLDNNIEILNKCNISFVNVYALNIDNPMNKSIISVSGLGINNETTFDNCDFQYTVKNITPTNTSQTFFSINGITYITNSSIYQLNDYKFPITMFDVLDRLYCTNNTMTCIISDGPTQPVSIFKTENNSFLLNKSINTTIIVTVISQPYNANVNYILSTSVDTITDTSSSLFVGGVSVDFFNLVNAENSVADVKVLDLTIPDVNMSRLFGFTKCVTFTVSSGEGNLNISGGLYSGIITVNAVDNPSGYILQENDSTVLSDGVDVFIFDPALASLQVTNIGKIIYIKNIGTIPISVQAQNNSIFDGNLTVSMLETVQLQSDGVKWYVI